MIVTNSALSNCDCDWYGNRGCDFYSWHEWSQLSSSSSSSGTELSGITAFASLEMIDLIDCAIARDVESPLLWPSRPRLTNFFNVAVQAHDQSTKN